MRMALASNDFVLKKSFSAVVKKMSFMMNFHRLFYQLE